MEDILEPSSLFSKYSLHNPPVLLISHLPDKTLFSQTVGDPRHSRLITIQTLPYAAKRLTVFLIQPCKKSILGRSKPELFQPLLKGPSHGCGKPVGKEA